jgi:TrmH family RNA methyltransferase
LITSTRNNKIKEIRRLQDSSKARQKSQSFVVEGVRLCEEALSAGWKIEFCLYSPELNPRGMAIVQELTSKGIPAEPASDHVIKAASDTKTPQGILMIVTLDPLPLPESPEFILILDQVQNPGNQGTLLRTAAAAGADAVLFSEGSADVFSPKVIRAGMGAHFRLPTAALSNQDIIAYCRLHDLTMWASILEEGIPYTQADLKAPAAIIVGSEAHGIGDTLLQAAQPIYIPMPGGGESLNAAAAGAILTYEVVRQRTG